jgi:hypothetical protein
MSTLPASLPPEPDRLDADEFDPEHPDTVDHSVTRVHENFWQQPFVQNVLPLITSVILLATILILAIILVPKIIQATRQVTQEQLIIPDASFAENGQPGGIPNPGLGNDPMREGRQEEFANVAQNSEGWANKASQTLTQTMLSGGLGENAADVSVIGVGPNSGSGKGSGVGQGPGTGAGTGDGSGALAPFGPAGGGGGIGPKFMKVGFGGNVRSIIFLCDASGSMIPKMPYLKEELMNAVDKLKPIQWFNVEFFVNDKPQQLADHLLPATPENKRKCAEFLNAVAAAGSPTDPIVSLTLAFKQQPQLIFLLTDGDFSDNAAVLTRVRQMNASGKTKVNTIAFVGENDTDKEFINTLTQIAKETGGVFKRVAESEVR